MGSLLRWPAGGPVWGSSDGTPLLRRVARRGSMATDPKHLDSRRSFLSRGAIIAGTALAGPGIARSARGAPLEVPPTAQAMGRPIPPTAYGVPSRFEGHVARRRTDVFVNRQNWSDWSMTPLQHQHGIVTPNGLIFERHHAGVPDIGPTTHTRPIQIEKVMDDVLLVYAQNGEMLRPEQGYPLRAFIPGWEGNVSVKWLRRIKVGDQPWNFRSETARYTDPMPDGKWRQFSFVMECKSVITRPSGGMKLERPGLHEIQGFAWSGRGRITAVDGSTDGGKDWPEGR